MKHTDAKTVTLACQAHDAAVFVAGPFDAWLLQWKSDQPSRAKS